MDYIVKDGQVIIVDEFTGRLMPGRRYSDGLHQALEAKENVTIARESQTLATITFQNFFRMYKKLAGMTGTADTEAVEFKKIYSLDVVVIPHEHADGTAGLSRQDLPHRTGKIQRHRRTRYASCNAKGQPILVGTISIEKSEKLSQHPQVEGDYSQRAQRQVPRAGGADHRRGREARRGHHRHEHGGPRYRHRPGGQEAVRRRAGIATCRSTTHGLWDDSSWPVLTLGFRQRPTASRNSMTGQDKHKAENIVRERTASGPRTTRRSSRPGGLHILGTERHEARRIDNQLRGRSGRQGDPGSSRFYLSLEDDLMRLFGSERIGNIMQRLGMEEGQEIESPMVTKAIASAQKRVEGRNFDIQETPARI